MKINNKFLVGIFTLAVICSACEDLDRQLETDLNKRQLESSLTSIQSLLNGVYATLPEGFYPIDQDAMMASATDEAEHTDIGNRVQAFNQGSWTASNNPADVWGVSYQGIRRANIFLETALPEKINLDVFRANPATLETRVKEITRWTYEARLLRAFFYFELIKRYGGVPLITSSDAEQNITELKRNTLAECIQFISDECDAVAPNLEVVSEPTADQGRVTRGTALALKSRLLLYAASELFNNPAWASGYANPEYIALPAGDRAARWKAAADAAKAVIDLPGTGYAVSTNYRTAFTTAYPSNVIFARRNVGSNRFETTNFPIGFTRGRGLTTPSQNLVDAYEIRVGTAWVPFDWNNLVHAANPYANRDPRLDLTVVTNGRNFSTISGQTRPVETFTGGRDGLPLPNATRTGYYLRKYVNEGVNLVTNTTAVHSWVFFRIEEIFLNYAEALNEYSPGHADIKTYYDRVRTRTGIGLPGLAAGSQAEVRQRIRNERRIEFAFEDHRAWDVRRWMTASTVLNEPIRGVLATRSGTGTVTYAPVLVENRNFQDKMYLFPIPQSEINILPNLKQNPFW